MIEKPPKCAQNFFSWYCRNRLHDSILGDLDERYYLDLEKHGPRKAKARYWIAVIGFLNKYTLTSDTSSKNSSNNSFIMFMTNIITSYRFLKRNKSFTFLNILGLCIGLTSFLLILFFVNHERSFENFHSNRDQVYRVNFGFSDSAGHESLLVNSPPAFAPGIQENFPELSKVTRMRYAQNCIFSNQDQQYYEDQGYYADSAFLDILKFSLSSGDPQSALNEPNSLVLTQGLAKKYFGHKNPLGSTLLLNNNVALKVTGVLNAIPSNSHLNFDFLISFQNYIVPEGYSSDLTSWDWLGFITYIELDHGADSKLFEKKLADLFKSIHPEDNHALNPMVQSLSDIYLGSKNLTDDTASHIRVGNANTVNSLMAIAILIVLIAGFNFSNLSHALSINRRKSTGIRKVLGAKSNLVIYQILTESLMLVVGCLFCSYVLSILIFPHLAILLDWHIVLGYIEVISTLPVLLLLALLMGIFAGIYPAFVLSGLNIISSLNGQPNVGRRSPFQLKNLLVLLQFAISIGLIATTFVLTQQLSYLRNKSTGFEKENVVVIKLLPEDMTRYFETFKELILENSGFVSVSRSDRTLGEAWPFTGILRTNQGSDAYKMIFFNLVDHDFFRTMGIKLQEGRSFSTTHSRDPNNGIILNQKAIEFLGIEDPIGKQVHFRDVDGPRTIIGVTEDFNYTSLHQEIGPVAMILPFIDLEYMYVRLAPGNIMDRIVLMENRWQEVSSGTPMEWRLLDDKLNELYKSEEKLSFLISSFSVLAVLLACLGLYGIVTFMINNRLKEVSVRKVLGASVLSLNTLFVRQYIIHIFIAMLLVIPLLHSYLEAWLQGFAYRIDIVWWVYPVATLLLLSIASLTVLHQTFKAAIANPVNVLRSE